MEPPRPQSLAAKEEFVLRGVNGHPLPEFSTASQIAEALQVTSRTILEWQATGKIPAALRAGRTVRFNPKEVATALGIRNSGAKTSW